MIDGIVEVNIKENELYYGGTDRDSKGSGFATLDSNGNLVVITAAHVVGNAELSDITLRTDTGEAIHPTLGCYTYEHKGVFAEVPNSDGEPNDEILTVLDTDVAVLRIPPDAPVLPLQLADTQPARGKWSMAANYQQYKEPGNPAIYPVLNTGQENGANRHAVIGGLSVLGPHATQGLVDNVSIRGGASGGVMVDPESGLVEGATTGSLREQYHLSTEYLADTHGVTIVGPGAEQYGNPEAGFFPQHGYIMPPSTIRTAMNSPLS